MKVKFHLVVVPLLTVFACLQPVTSPFHKASAQGLLRGETQARQLQRGEEIKNLPGKNKRWALVIGIDEYSESQITSLSGASNDARTLADALTKYAGFPEDQVTLLASNQPPGLQPRRSTILRYLSNLRGTVPKDGLLLVSFAGHGIERGGRAFLLPSDALGVNDMALLEDTAIGVERIKESIRATGVGQVILILDACRNDPTSGRSGGDNLMTAEFRSNFDFDLRNKEIRAFVTLYATDIGERAYEYGVKQQGYFTWTLVEGLRGAAANDAGQVTLQRLVDYLQEIVPKLVRRDLGSDNRQRPFAIIEGYRAADLVIAVAPTVRNRVSNTSPAPGSNDADGERTLWETIRDSTNAQEYQDYLLTYPRGTYASVARARIKQLERAKNKVLVAQAMRLPDRVRTRRPNANNKITATSFRSVWIVSNPPNSDVSLDGVMLGNTGATGELELKLKPATYSIRLSREGYLSLETEVEISPAPYPQEAAFMLSPALGSVWIVSDLPHCNIIVDDDARGNTGADGRVELKLRAGTHIIHLSKEGYLNTHAIVDVGLSLEPREVRFTLTPVAPTTSPTPQNGSPLPSKDGIESLNPQLALLVKGIERNVRETRLVAAFIGYDQLYRDTPNHPELPRLLEIILQGLQGRSTETLKQVGMFGISLPPQQVEEMKKLYQQARKWKAGDEIMDNFGKYWDVRYSLAELDRTPLNELENLRRTTRAALSDLGEHDVRNAYLSLDVGWTWWKLNDRAAAQKHFILAQELRPDWAYPRFALGVLAMSAAESETTKSAKTIKYGEAIESFTKAINLKHDFARAYALRCISFALLNRHEESTKNGLQAIALEPRSAYSHFALGVAYFQRGKSGYRAAREEFNMALTLDAAELDQAARRSIQELLARINKSFK